MPDIPIGAQGRHEMIVTSEVAISFLNNEEARVLATPWLIAFLEMTARDTVKPFLSDDEDTVGTQVNVSHLAATPMGLKAVFEAEVLQVEGQRVLFRVAAHDDRDRIAEGTHERFVIDVKRFARKVQAKKAGA